MQCNGEEEDKEELGNLRDIEGVSPEGTPCTLCRRPLQPLEQRLRHLPERPLCNACCFREMDPFKPVRELEHVMFMAVLPGRQLTFDLEVADLRQWRKDGFEVELRGLRRRRVSESQGLQQVWPSFLSVEVNGHEVFTTKVPLRGHKRRDVPQSLSANLRRGSNTVEITAEDERRRDYMLAVVRTFPVRPKDLAPLVPEDGYQECLHRIQMLLQESVAQGKAHHGVDGVERVGDERLKLQCPVTLMRPSTAVRGVDCRHFQCMDLDPYLISNYRMKAFNSRWRCPLCSLDLRPKDLRIDSFVQMLLKETEPEVEEVLLFPDGTWEKGAPVPQTRTPSSSPSPQPPARPLAQAKGPGRRARPRPKASGVTAPRGRKRRKGLLPIGVLPVAGPAPPPKRRRRLRDDRSNGTALANHQRSEALARRRSPARAPIALRPVRRVPVAQRRAAVIAAGPNKSVGVDSDASPEMVSDSDAEPVEEIAKIKATRSTRRQRRMRDGIQTIGLVGYTNVGKSAIVNRLSGSDLLVKDGVFVTLDIAARRFTLPSGSQCYILDSVGFIKDLPLELCEVFQATIQELHEADVILHVRDMAHPAREEQRTTVQRVLMENDMDPERVMEVWNKTDLLTEKEVRQLFYQHQLQVSTPVQAVSALTGEGFEELLEKLDQKLQDLAVRVVPGYRSRSALEVPVKGPEVVRIPQDLPQEQAAELWAFLAETGAVLDQSMDTCQDTGDILLEVKMDNSTRSKFLKKFGGAMLR